MLGFAVLTAVATVALLLAEWRNWRPGVWIAKPLAATGFVGIGLAAGALDSTTGRWIALGLALCWMGDVLLIPRERPAVFQLGIGAFLLGHVAYVVAFLQAGLAPVYAIAAAAVLAGPVVAVLRWLLPKVPDDFRIPVYAYTAVISAMVVAAVGAFGAGAPAASLAGALLFYASDISVARDRFVSKSFVNGAWGLPAYFGGQLLIASTAGAFAS